MAWAPEDRAKVLAYQIEKALRCSMCGTADWEWEQDRRAYEGVEHTCIGCHIRESISKEMDNAPGRTVQLMPSKGPEAEARRARAARMGKRR